MLLNTLIILSQLDNHWDWSYISVHPQWKLRKSSYCVNLCLLLQSTKLMLGETMFEVDKVSLEQTVNRTSLLKYRNNSSFPSNFVPALLNDTFAIINTQLNKMPGEHRIMVAMFHHVMCFAESLGGSIKNNSFLKQ